METIGLSQATKDYLREITTLDVRAVEYYFDDSGGKVVAYDYLNPSQYPNLEQYRVVKLWDLRHYSQKGSGYEKKIRLVANEIEYYEKIPLLKVERINETYVRFWKWYGEQAQLQRENRFETLNFILGLNNFFICLSDEGNFEPNTHGLEPRFLQHLHDAIMLKHSTLKRLIQEIKAIAPPVATSTEAKQEKKGGRTNDPYNAKVKATFLDMVIDDGIIIIQKEIYRNNDERFAHYANTLKGKFGLVVSAGTLENNWGKRLNIKEKTLLRELLITQNLKHLAVKVITVEK